MHSLLLGLSACLFLSPLSAVTPPVLSELSTTAHRGQTPWAQLASAVDVRNEADIRQSGFISIGDLLQEMPGLEVVSTGAPGGLRSLFLRGSNSNQFVFRVDGVRVNDANTDYAPFLGALGSRGAGRVEVIRGPQSSLFGGSAVGGVVSVSAPEPAGEDFARVWGGLGNFATLEGGAEGSASDGDWSVYGMLEGTRTDNERPNNAFEQVRAVASVVWDDGDLWRIRTVFRGLSSRFEEPGIIPEKGFPSPGISDLRQALNSVTIDFRPSGNWQGTLIVGHQDQSYAFEETAFPFSATNRRFSTEGLLRREGANGSQLLLGLEAETARHSGFNTGTENQAALFSQFETPLGEDRHASISLRLARYRSFGDKATGRITFIEGLPAWGTKLRATAGTGFQPPSLSDRFGSAFTQPNADLKPEQSLGWDIGWDQLLFSERVVSRLTVFQNRIDDLLTFESAPFPEQGRVINVNKARTEGVEWALEGQLTEQSLLRIAYTYLEASNRSTDTRLLRRPRHSLAAGLSWQEASGSYGISANLRAVQDRLDSDFSSFPSRQVDPGAFWDLRSNAFWLVNPRLELGLSLQNILNQKYEEVFGYPARGFSGLLTATLRWGP